MLIWFEWIELHLKNSRNDLTSCGVRSKSRNETNHCCPAVKLFRFRCHNSCFKTWSKYKENWMSPRELIPLLRLWKLILSIKKAYLIIDLICAEWSFFSCSFLFAKWLFNIEDLELLFTAIFNSDWCNAFLLAFCLSKRIFNSVELEWLGLDAKNNSALWSEFFLQRLFLIKGRWFITFLSRGNPVPCYPNMHFPKENERS